VLLATSVSTTMAAPSVATTTSSALSV
jgi:hypothetical protein